MQYLRLSGYDNIDYFFNILQMIIIIPGEDTIFYYKSFSYILAYTHDIPRVIFN